MKKTKKVPVLLKYNDMLKLRFEKGLISKLEHQIGDRVIKISNLNNKLLIEGNIIEIWDKAKLYVTIDKEKDEIAHISEIYQQFNISEKLIYNQIKNQ